MKISAKKYAQALWDLTAGKNQSEIEQIVKEFVRVLALNNNLRREQEIINEFQKMADVQAGIVRAKITSVNELNDESLNQISGYIKNIAQAKNVVMETERKKELIGGVVIRYKDRVIDFSLKNKVRELREKMSR